MAADEVRKLAEKSASAASEIDKVTLPVEKHSLSVRSAVAEGTRSLRASESFLESLAEVLASATAAVTRTEAGVNGITASAREQHATADHISGSVEQVAEMTEKNRPAMERVFGAPPGTGTVVRLAPGQDRVFPRVSACSAGPRRQA